MCGDCVIAPLGELDLLLSAAVSPIPLLDGPLFAARPGSSTSCHFLAESNHQLPQQRGASSSLRVKWKSPHNRARAKERHDRTTFVGSETAGIDPDSPEQCRCHQQRISSRDSNCP